jgi:hypothetical protein
LGGKLKRDIFCTFVAISFLFYGCIAPSQADIEYAIHQTQTAEVKTNKPIATFSPNPPEMSLCAIEPVINNSWKTILCEDFDSSSNNFSVGKNPSYGTDNKIEGGKYIINYDSKNSSGYTTGLSYYQQFSEASDYFLSINGKIDSNFRDNIWGVVVRGFNDGYSFAIDNNGSYYLTYLGASGGNNYIGNLDYGRNSAIKWGKDNNIIAIVEGKLISFYVNGSLILSYETDDSSSKEISFFLWAAEGVRVSYIFDNIVLKEK